MKIKKWLALALSAVMAVGVLTACGGGGGGVKDSLSVGGVRTELKQVSSDFTVNEDSSLNVAVRAGAKKLAETGSESAATSYINSEMEWDGLSVVRNAFREIITQGFIIGGSVSGGVIQVVEADAPAAGALGSAPTAMRSGNCSPSIRLRNLPPPWRSLWMAPSERWFPG